MAFGVTQFQTAPPGTALTSIVPTYEVISDYWTFAVSYKDTTGSAQSLAGLTPGAEIFPGYNGQAIALSIVNTVANVVTFGFAGSSTLVPQGVDALTFPVRLHAFLTDGLGHRTTYLIQAVVPISAANSDLTKLPPTASLVAVAGPSGPQGIPGIAADQAAIQAAITAAITNDIPLLKGDKGDTGQQGIPGQQGVQGPPGTAGSPGPKGDKGDQGAQGQQGQTGAASTVPGPKGDKGDTGLQGAPGAASTVSGPRGDKGDQGAQGAQGGQGLPGQKGDPGTTGLILGSGAPTSTPAANNLGYFDTASLAFYVSGSGVWNLFGYLSPTPGSGSGAADYSGALILDMSAPGPFSLH